MIEDVPNPMKGTLNMMAGFVGVLIAGLSAAFFLRPRRRSAIFGSKSNDSHHLHTQQVDQENFLLGKSDGYGDDNDAFKYEKDDYKHHLYQDNNKY